MKYLLKPNFVALVSALLISGLFLWMALTPPSVFNMLPSEIHEAINPGGVSENKFIIVFDVLVALLLLVFVYMKLYNRLNISKR